MGGGSLSKEHSSTQQTEVEVLDEALGEVAGTAVCQGPEARKILVHTRRQKEGPCVTEDTVRKGECVTHSGGEAGASQTTCGPQTTGKVPDYIFFSFLKLINYSILFLVVQHGLGIPQPGVEPGPLAVQVRSPNHWTAREVPGLYFKCSQKAVSTPFALSAVFFSTYIQLLSISKNG